MKDTALSPCCGGMWFSFIEDDLGVWISGGMNTQISTEVHMVTVPHGIGD